MTVLNESRHAGEFLLSEANGHRSREQVTIASGENLEAGAVLGQVTASGEYAEHNPAGADGTETAAGILLAAVDATDGAVDGVAIVRDAEVVDGALNWPDGITEGDKTAAINALADNGVVVR